jgi:hypothetical protein
VSVFFIERAQSLQVGMKIFFRPDYESAFSHQIFTRVESPGTITESPQT